MQQSSTSDERAPRTIHLGLFLVCLSTLFVEICLIRIFSFTIGYHFAFIIISVALLGFGASGSVLLLLARRIEHWDSRSMLAGISACAAIALVPITQTITHVRFNPFDILTVPFEIVNMAIYMGIATFFFFFAGMVVAIALSRFPRQAGTLYFADMVGSGLACLFFVPVMNLLGPRYLIVSAAILYVLGALCFARKRPAALIAAMIGICAVTGYSSITMEFHPSKDKLHSLFIADGARIIHSRWSALFRTDLFDWQGPNVKKGQSYGTYGIGKTYDGELPAIRMINHDGGASAVMLNADAPLENFEMLRQHMLAVPYPLRVGGSVFIGGVGGGVDIQAAIANGASSILGVELDPNTKDIICGEYSDYVGNFCEREDVTIVAGDARSVLRNADQKFDIINFTGVDTITSAATGAYLLQEGYLYTTEAYHDYFDHLNPGGIISIKTFDLDGMWGQPRMVPRFTMVAIETLRERGIEDPSEHIVIISDCRPGACVLPLVAILAKEEPFTPGEIEQLRNFVDEQGFAFWYAPGEQRSGSIPEQLIKMSPEERESFLDSNYLDLSAPNDDKPFFLHFFKWSNVATYWTAARFSNNYLESTGNVMLLIAFGISVGGAFLLIVLPAVWHTWRIAEGPRIQWADVGFFMCIGVGFMLIEISLMQKLTLFLGYPTYSVTVTLFSMLTFAGIGSGLSMRLPLLSTRPIWALVTALAILVAVYTLIGDTVLLSLLHLPVLTRCAIAAAAIAPIGLLLGTFLPLAVRNLADRNPSAVPLAWAANGSCSVIGTVLATLLATIFGFRMVAVLALSLYVLAAIFFSRAIANDK